MPPSTKSSPPFTWPASSDTRNTTALATSSGWPTRQPFARGFFDVTHAENEWMDETGASRGRSGDDEPLSLS